VPRATHPKGATAVIIAMDNGSIDLSLIFISLRDELFSQLRTQLKNLENIGEKLKLGSKNSFLLALPVKLWAYKYRRYRPILQT